MGKVYVTHESNKYNLVFCRLKRVEVTVYCKQFVNVEFLHLTCIT